MFDTVAGMKIVNSTIAFNRGDAARWAEASIFRVFGTTADIGAFESSAPDRIFNGHFDAGSPCAVD